LRSISQLAHIAWKVASGALASSRLSSPRADNGAQWADEVINAKDKTTLTGEAKELEQEIELRKEGLQRCACSTHFSGAVASSFTYHNLSLHHQGCNLPQNSTISQYLRKGFLMLSMTPTSFFPERHLELLWSAMEKILQKTLYSVTMASSVPLTHSWLNDVYDRTGAYNFRTCVQ